MKYHPYADLFPLLEGTEYLDLVADVKAHGLLNPITIFDDMVLDGRNRDRACADAGVTPRYEKLGFGLDPLRFVASQNLMRRHLTKVERSFIGASMATMKSGYNEKSAKLRTTPEPIISQSEAAKLVDVSPRYVQIAKVVLDSGNAELIADTKAGKVSMADAEKQARTGEPAKRKAPKEKVVSGSKGKKRPTPAPVTDSLRDKIREHTDETGAPPTRGELKAAVGGSANATADLALAAEKAWRDGYQAGLNAAAANPELLGATFGAKYERAVKNMDRIIKEEVEFQTRLRVEADMKKLVDEFWLPHEKQRIERLGALAKRKTPFTYDEYRKLLAALHPDKPDGDDRVAAFQLVKDRAPILRPIQKEEEPPPFIIRTRDEFLAEKARRAAEAKKATHAGARS
jgi:hypothetical protein